jgi:hypothetical protein
MGSGTIIPNGVPKQGMLPWCGNCTRHTLTNRHSANGDRLFFFVRNGEMTLDEIQIRPLLSQPVEGVPAIALDEQQGICESFAIIAGCGPRAADHLT